MASSIKPLQRLPQVLELDGYLVYPGLERPQVHVLGLVLLRLDADVGAAAVIIDTFYLTQ